MYGVTDKQRVQILLNELLSTLEPLYNQTYNVSSYAGNFVNLAIGDITVALQELEDNSE